MPDPNYIAMCEAWHFLFFLAFLALALLTWTIYSLYRWRAFYTFRRYALASLCLGLLSHMIADYAELGF